MSYRCLQRYLAGDLHRDRAAEELRAVALMEQPDALLGYVDYYRAYWFAYTLGRDRFLSALASAGGEKERWGLLHRLIIEDTPTRFHAKLP